MGYYSVYFSNLPVMLLQYGTKTIGGGDGERIYCVRVEIDDQKSAQISAQKRSEGGKYER